MSLPVVVLNDVPHGPDSREVLVDALRADVVQGLRRPGIPVGAGEVHSHLLDQHGCIKTAELQLQSETTLI